MSQQTCTQFKKEYAIGPCILIIGILGIIIGLMMSPDKFPTVSLFLAGIGSVLSIVIPQKF